MEKREIEEMEK